MLDLATARPATDTTTSLRASIDLAAVRHNVARIARESPVMAVVKADGFGHGASRVARAALQAGACSLGVATIGEALQLRADGIAAPILAWLHDPTSDHRRAIEAGIDLAVASPHHVAAIVRAARLSAAARPAHIQLHLDTGLHRGGCDPSDWPALLAAARAEAASGTIRVTGIWSHLIHPSDPLHPGAAQQCDRLQRAVADAVAAGLNPGAVHLANSAAGLANPATRFDLVRAGLGCYGVEPCVGANFDLRPALHVTSRIVGLHHVAAGDGIGYDHTVRAARDTTLAVIPVGYADGIPTAAAGRGDLVVGGTRCRILGRVTMDQVTIDVTGLDVALGDEVAVLGGPHGPSATELATRCGVVPHELLTGLGNGPRVARSWVDAR